MIPQLSQWCRQLCWGSLCLPATYVCVCVCVCARARACVKLSVTLFPASTSHIRYGWECEFSKPGSRYKIQYLFYNGEYIYVGAWQSIRPHHSWCLAWQHAGYQWYCGHIWNHPNTVEPNYRQHHLYTHHWKCSTVYWSKSANTMH
jgi:hypothetical protein